MVEAFNELCSDLKGIKLLLVGPFEDELDPLSEKTKLLISNKQDLYSLKNIFIKDFKEIINTSTLNYITILPHLLRDLGRQFNKENNIISPKQIV